MYIKREEDLLELRHKFSGDVYKEELLISGVVHKLPFFSFPFRLDFIAILICHEGELSCTYDLQEFKIKKHDMAIMMNDHIITCNEASDDFSATFIILSTPLATSQRRKDSARIQTKVIRHPVIHYSEAEFQAITSGINILRHIIRKKVDDNKNDLINKLFELLFSITYEAESLWSESLEIQASRNEQLFERFNEEIVRCHGREREVKYYADKLCLTPKYLSSIIKKVSGHLANEWINQYVILEAKSMLKTKKDMTILDISDGLKFSEQSAFCKFFKRHTGMSPTEFRNS